jgi:hypothetical protein
MGIDISTGKPQMQYENSLQRMTIDDSQSYLGQIVHDPCVSRKYSDMVRIDLSVILSVVSLASTGRRRRLLRMLRT